MKLNVNHKYTTISLYVIVVFFICMLLYRTLMAWDDSLAFITSVMSILAPFLIGMLIAYFITPMVNFFHYKWISKIKIGRFKIRSQKKQLSIAIFLAYLIFTSAVVLLLAIIIPQLTKSVADFSNQISDFEDYFTLLNERLDSMSIVLFNTTYYFDSQILMTYLTDDLPNRLQQLSALIPNLLNLAKDFASALVNLIIAYVVSIYVVASKSSAAHYGKKLVVALFTPKTAREIFDTVAYAHRVFSSFFIGKLIDSLIIGLLCFIILLIFKFPFALLISVFVGITNIIPYFGPFIGGGISFVLLLFISPIQALWFLVVIVGLQQFDGNILGPWILGDSVGLSPFWVIFAIIIFGSMFGLIGMFLGVPLLSVIRYILIKPIDALYQRRTKLSIDAVDAPPPTD